MWCIYFKSLNSIFWLIFSALPKRTAGQCLHGRPRVLVWKWNGASDCSGSSGARASVQPNGRAEGSHFVCLPPPEQPSCPCPALLPPPPGDHRPSFFFHSSECTLMLQTENYPISQHSPLSKWHGSLLKCVQVVSISLLSPCGPTWTSHLLSDPSFLCFNSSLSNHGILSPRTEVTVNVTHANHFTHSCYILWKQGCVCVCLATGLLACCDVRPMQRIGDQ